MDDDSWVEQARLAAGSCPQCGSLDVRPILYGMPDADSFHRLQDVVVFAGCCVPEDPRGFMCGVCSASWGRRVDLA
jgi:hypothetical protein